MAQARGCFERALALDPVSVDALVGSGIVDVNSAVAFFTGDRAARIAAAEAAVTRALSLAPDHALAHLVKGMILGFTNRFMASPNSSTPWLRIETWPPRRH